MRGVAAKPKHRGSQPAARIGAVFLLGLAVLLLLRIADGSTTANPALLATVGGTAVLGAVAFVVPWSKVGWAWTLLLPAVAFVLFGLSLTQAEQHPNAYLLYPFAGFVWLGLAYPPGIAMRLGVPALLVAGVPALLTGTVPRTLLSYPVVFLFGALLAELLARILAELRGSLDHARASDQARAALIGTLAHDLRSPTATMAGTVRLLRERDRELDVETRESLLTSAERQAERLLDLAESLVDSDRVGEGALTLKRVWLDPIEVVQRAAWLVGVEVDVADGAGLRIFADRQRLQHVLTNVLDNARRHGAPPYTVTVSREEPSDAGQADGCGGVRLTVRDHGSGVPTRLVEVAFDRFVHGGSSGSTGLGLWLVRNLVEAHGGQVWIEDADPGTRVVLVVPDA